MGHNVDGIRLLNSAIAVANGDDSLALLSKEVAKDTRFGGSVDSAGGLVEDNDGRIAIQVARQGQALPLPTRQVDPCFVVIRLHPFADIAASTMRELTDKIGCLGLAQRSIAARCIYRLRDIAIPDILVRRGEVVADELLPQHSQLPVPGCWLIWRRSCPSMVMVPLVGW